jgi:hypothetical protein
MRDEAEKARQHLKDFAWSCRKRYAKAVNTGKAMLDGTVLEEDEESRF